MFSIVIPTLNNLKYLKLAIASLEKNSKYMHELIVHVNIGNDGTLKYLRERNIKHTFTDYNAGITKGVNLAVKIVSNKYLVYAHDDFYFCPNWDYYLFNEINKMKDDLFYLSGTMINNGQVKFDCGNTISTFNEKKLLSSMNSLKTIDFQGSTWAPTLVSKRLWNQVGGFSEEYSAGTGSDPDFNMKLWKIGVRIFKGVGKSRVYHFGSIVSRKNMDNNIKWAVSRGRGGKIFLLKWGITIKFFTRFYLRGCKTLNKTLICNKFDGSLQDPEKKFYYYLELFKNKIFYIYLKIIHYK
jgi:glycosyltransferase involved in cell wall biosynthesis